MSRQDMLHDVDGTRWIILPGEMRGEDYTMISQVMPVPITPENPLGFRTVQKLRIPSYLVNDLAMSILLIHMPADATADDL